MSNMVIPSQNNINIQCLELCIDWKETHFVQSLHALHTHFL